MVYLHDMVTVIFVDADGSRYPVEAPVAGTLMEAAIANEVPSIVAFCGGMCACGTCHCYPEPGPGMALPPVGENEADMLTRVLDPKPASRLACQIRIDSSHEGLIVHLPRRQRVP